MTNREKLDKILFESDVMVHTLIANRERIFDLIQDASDDSIQKDNNDYKALKDFRAKMEDARQAFSVLFKGLYNKENVPYIPN